MTKKNNKKTPEPMFVGTEPEEMVKNIESPQNLEDFPVTSGQMEEMGSVTWVSENSVTEVPYEEPKSSYIVGVDGLKDGPTLSVAQGAADKYLKEEPKPETDDGTKPEPPLSSVEIALKIIDASGGKFPTQIMDSLIQPGQKVYEHPFDPINDLHYQLNNAIQPLVDSMQKIIRDPYKAKESMSEQHFNYMIKEYGYLHSFLELSHKLIKERLRERDSKRG